MPRTVEGIVAAHEAATALRKAGRPIWAEKIIAPSDEEAPFEYNRDAFVAALERSAWFKRQQPGDELYELWEEIREAEDADHFNAVLDDIYDIADVDRIWIWFEHSGR